MPTEFSFSLFETIYFVFTYERNPDIPLYTGMCNVINVYLKIEFKHKYDAYSLE